jgi:arginine N-succinyltransferase
MDFEGADLHNAAHGNQFIQDLMPRHPVYTVFLSPEARACIGRPHDSARAAYDMLMAEGFEWDQYIDIFDGGPLVDAKTNQIRTIRESRVRRVFALGDVSEGDMMMMAAGAVSSFRCLRAKGRIDGESLIIAKETAKALNVKAGDSVRCVAW